MTRLRRAVHFVPGANEKMLEKSLGLAADSLVLDLEDAVTPENKDEARRIVTGWLDDVDFGRQERVVRMNPLDSPWGARDLEVSMEVAPDAFLVPKVSSRDEVLELDRAEDTVVRFLVNSTVGVLGLFDVATDWGYPYHDEDFGQTLGVHGVGEGFYIVIPIFGPSSARDGIGTLVDTFLDPLTYVASNNDAEEYLILRTAVAGIDLRSRNIESLDDLKRDSIDFYARIRSLYRQRRANEIKNGEVEGDTPTPGLFSFDFESDGEAQGKGESQ